jgi:hypothetical protein
MIMKSLWIEKMGKILGNACLSFSRKWCECDVGFIGCDKAFKSWFKFSTHDEFWDQRHFFTNFDHFHNSLTHKILRGLFDFCKAHLIIGFRYYRLSGSNYRLSVENRADNSIFFCFDLIHIFRRNQKWCP